LKELSRPYGDGGVIKLKRKDKRNENVVFK